MRKRGSGVEGITNILGCVLTCSFCLLDKVIADPVLRFWNVKLGYMGVASISRLKWFDVGFGELVHWCIGH